MKFLSIFSKNFELIIVFSCDIYSLNLCDIDFVNDEWEIDLYSFHKSWHRCLYQVFLKYKLIILFTNN